MTEILIVKILNCRANPRYNQYQRRKLNPDGSEGIMHRTYQGTGAIRNLVRNNGADYILSPEVFQDMLQLAEAERSKNDAYRTKQLIRKL